MLEKQDLMNVAQNLTRLRKERGWSQRELASKIGAQPSNVNRFEQEKTLPSLETAVKIADAFQVSIDDLIRGTDVIEEISLDDKSFAEKVALLNKLGDDEKDVVTKVIDALLTKQKMKQLLNETDI